MSYCQQVTCLNWAFLVRPGAHLGPTCLGEPVRYLVRFPTLSHGYVERYAADRGTPRGKGTKLMACTSHHLFLHVSLTFLLGWDKASLTQLKKDRWSGGDGSSQTFHTAQHQHQHGPVIYSNSPYKGIWKSSLTNNFAFLITSPSSLRYADCTSLNMPHSFCAGIYLLTSYWQGYNYEQAHLKCSNVSNF